MKISINHAGTTIEYSDDKNLLAETAIKIIKSICDEIKGLQAQVKVFSDTKISESELREGNQSNHEFDGTGWYSNKIGFVK